MKILREDICKRKEKHMKAYQLKIVLKNSKPPIWRRCIIPSGITFSQLSLLLNEIMGWCGGHLSEYEFYHRKLRIMEDDGFDYFQAPWDYDLLDSAKTFIDEFMESEDWFTYTYDLGDDWAHRVTIEKVIENYEENIAKVLKYKGNCPPEDIGGIGMYYALLDGTFEEITGFSADGVFEEEYDIDDVNDCLREMYFVHWDEYGDKRLAHTIFEDDIVNKKGLIGCKNPVNDYDLLDFHGGDFDEDDERKEISEYEKADKALKDMTELMQKHIGNLITAMSNPKRPLSTCLTSFTKEDLIDIGTQHGLDIKKSWKKDKMLKEVCDAILNPETFQRNISRLSEKEIEAFEKAMNSIEYYLLSPHEYILFDALYNWGYALITMDNEVIVSSDIEELYKEINNKEFKKSRKYINWINQSIFYLQSYYGCAPISIVLKLVNAKKTIRMNEEQLTHFLTDFNDRVTLIGDYVIANELVEAGDYEEFMLWQGKDKDYYIPPEDEIAYLYEHKFYKPSKYDFEMIRFMETICENHYDAIMAEQIIQRMIYNEESLQDIIDELENADVLFREEKDIREFITLFNDLWNNTRLLANKGHTPLEIASSLPIRTDKKPTIVPVRSEAAKLLAESKEELEQKGVHIDLESTAQNMNVFDVSKNGEISYVREKKVYPNDPCPCGSGKKFKKCCGKNK